jgi:FK506-binding protein 4/5
MELYLKKKKDFEFIIGTEQVISGIDQAIQQMKKGEKALITVKPQYAYGSEGNSELKIPPNETVQYELELIDYVKEKESWEMNFEEKYEVATKKKRGRK